MRKRLIHKQTSADGKRQARVYRDVEWEQFIVKLDERMGTAWIHQESADYHTTDKDDALHTAEGFVTKRF